MSEGVWYFYMDLSTYNSVKFPENFRIDNIDSLRSHTPKQAQKFFIWHQSVLHERVDYLLKFCSQSSGISFEDLYAFPNGTLPIWRWFLKIAEVVPLSPEDKERMFRRLAPQMAGHPSSVMSDVISDLIPDYVMSAKTEEILWDIAMYVGDGFTRISPKLHWELFSKKKSDVDYNRPVIQGFTPPGIIPGRTLWMEPIGIVRVQALHFVDGEGKESDLNDIVKKWISGA